MLEDKPLFQAWVALVFLGLIATIPILAMTDGEGWGRVPFLGALGPAILSIAGFMLAVAGVLLFVIASPFIPDPPKARIPSRDLRAVERSGCRRSGHGPRGRHA